MESLMVKFCSTCSRDLRMCQIDCQHLVCVQSSLALSPPHCSAPSAINLNSKASLAFLTVGPLGMAGTSGYNGDIASSSRLQAKRSWRESVICSASSSTVVSPSTSCTSSSLTQANEDINEVLGQLGEEQVPFYKQPDQYQGLVHKIRESLREKEPELELSKQLLSKLKTKAERLLPNVNIPCSQSLSSLMTMLDTPSYCLPSSPGSSSNISCIDPNVQAVIDSLEPVELPAKSLKNTTCEICHEVFASAQSKLRHAKRKHADQLDKVVSRYAQSSLPFACPTCQKSFSNPAVLRSHQRRHDEDQQRFHCPTCPKKYIMGSELRKHIKHTHEKPSSGAVEPVNKRGKNAKSPLVEDMPEIL